MENARFIIRTTALALLVSSLCACSTASKVLNPFYEEPSEIALMGDSNDHALRGTEKEDHARAALDHMATYQRAHYPSPVRPVMEPAVVRLMWVPDHLNKHGDLIPAHYYYLKVLKERWAVQDAFDLQQQLGENDKATGIPFVTGK